MYAKTLSRADRKAIDTAIRKAKKEDKKQMSAQDSIPFKQMFKDGICRVDDNYYTKTIRFQDINYQLNQNEDKTAIFDGWSDFLNYFDSSVHFELSFMNLSAKEDSYSKRLIIEPQGDDFDEIRAEYSEMLQDRLSRGNNGLIKTKYITFGIEAENIQMAKPRLERIENDIINNFKRLGVKAHPLNGTERLKVMYDMFHLDASEPFRFAWDRLSKTGLSVKDFIAPSSFEFRSGYEFKVGDKHGSAYFLQILAPELSDRMLADFLDMESSVIVSMHIQSVDQIKAIKTIKRKITDLDKMKIEEQKKAVRSGYDMDIIPSDLATYGGDAKKLLQDLQSRNERMFLMTFIVVNLGDTKKSLDNNVFQAKSIAQKYNCTLECLDFKQEEALMSSLPLGKNLIEIQRGLTTSNVAIFIPFTTQELFQSGKEALYCGVNALSNNLIMVDRKLLKNPNGLILGTPGSGKSFAAKREIANVFLVTEDDIIVCDPEAEYGALVERLHGQVIKISPTSGDYINPMDLNSNYSDDENPLSLKSDFILSLCELIVGGKDGLQPVEKTIIDRCVRLIYRKYINDPKPENMPILENLYNELRKQDEKEAQYIATALEIYVTGSLNVFNHRTNVDIHSRVVSYDIKELGKQLKKIGMLIVQDQVWNRVTVNREAHKSTRYYIDEMHLLLKVVRMLSDIICFKHGLSIIEHPKRHGKSYNSWLGENEHMSNRDYLIEAIDKALAQKPKSYDEFFALLKQDGYSVVKGKHLTFSHPRQKQNIRVRSLGDGYSERDIQAVILGNKVHSPKSKKRRYEKTTLLSDIEKMINSDKGAAYENWAKKFSAKQIAKSIIYLKEHDYANYDEFAEAVNEKKQLSDKMAESIKDAERRLSEIAVLKKHIINYSKTKDIYVGYRKSGYSKKYLVEHEADIVIHKAAKRAFDELKLDKLPSIKSLNEEYAKLLNEKKANYAEYSVLKKELREMLLHKQNYEYILGIENDKSEKSEQTQNVEK